MSVINALSTVKSAEQSKIGYKYEELMYEGVIVSTALYGTKAWGMISAERRKVNVEKKCLCEVWWNVWIE